MTVSAELMLSLAVGGSKVVMVEEVVALRKGGIDKRVYLLQMKTTFLSL